MISFNETFEGTFPFAPHMTDAAGFNMHYIDEGEGPLLLCLHGEPTWGYLFRHLVTRLSNSYRFIVPDHMGFGKSETPANRSYWLQDHIHNIEQLVLALDLRNITLVMHDFGGPVGMGLAARHPERISRLVFINAPAPLGQEALAAAIQANVAASPWFQWVMQAEKEGRLETVLNESHYSILSTLVLNGFERRELITPLWLEAWRRPFATPEDCRGVTGWAKGFATGKHIFETPSEAARIQLSRLPALALWGAADKTLHAKHFLPLFHAAFPAGKAYELPGVGHYSLEDAPDTVALLVRQFLDLTR
ncbi:alpha/beta fold hydrolase [Chitinophaga vietnamensis]|uniref:alpha/beta fold hydrolase n=1 Tax=Chitinophaga vietnamensis TaxID=2593957 RepID=UPI001177575F|nr:alpha/beta fold hydrolase [Chitinophaga vietnamensis]